MHDWQTARETYNVNHKIDDLIGKDIERIAVESEHSTSYGREILSDLNDVALSALDLLFSNSRITRNYPIYKQFIVPAMFNYGLQKKKYKTLRSPIELMAGTLAYNIAKSASSEILLNQVAYNTSAVIMRDLGMSKDEQQDFRHIFNRMFLKVIEDMAELSDIFIVVHGHSESKHIIFLPHYQQHIDELKEQEHIPVTVYEPMLTKPDRHFNLYNRQGGYKTMNSPVLKRVVHTQAMRQFNRKNNLTFFKVLDKMQETGYVVNRALLEVLEGHSQLGYKLNDFPFKLSDFADEMEEQKERVVTDYQNYLDGLKALHIAQGKEPTGDYTVGAKKARELRKPIINSYQGRFEATKATLSLAHEYAPYGTFFYPYYCDQRGRFYPYANTGLSPTGNELGKALLNFANKERPTISGIKAYFDSLGNAIGWDKYHTKVKRKKAREFWNKYKAQFIWGDFSPIYNLQDELDEPITALSICLDLVQFKLDPEWQSGFIAHQDARCSGVALNSVLLGDADAAKLTSVIDSWDENLKLEDAYQATADRALEILQQYADSGDTRADFILANKDKLITRKIAKTPTMTVSNYGGTAYGVNEFLKSELLSKVVGLSDTHIYLLRDAMIQAIDDVIVCSKQYREAATKAGKICTAEKGMIEFINPITGFPVSIRKMVMEKKTVEYKTLAGVRVQSQQFRPTDKVNHAKNVSGTPPHIIHSLDASLIYMVYRDSSFDISCIHDSIGCLVNNVSKVKKIYNSALYYMACNNPLRVIFHSMSNGSVSVPTVGSMTEQQIEAIKDAKFSIC